MKSIDEYILGCSVPRRLRKGSRPRLQSARPGYVVEQLDGGFHEDEREALEALCFLSSAGMQPPVCVAKPSACNTQQFVSAVSKGEGCDTGDAQAQQQHSKGSCETAVYAADSLKAAAAYQLCRQYSPSSDISSAAYHAAVLVQDTPAAQPHEQPIDLVDIHPAALLPLDVCMTGIASAAVPALSMHPHLQQQQQQQCCHSAARHWQQLLLPPPQQAPEKEVPHKVVVPSCLPHKDHVPTVQPPAARAAEQQLQPILASEAAKKGPAPVPPPPQWTASSLYQPASGVVPAASQPHSAPGVTPLVEQQHLAAITAQGCRAAAPANVAPDILQQLYLPAGLPHAALPLLLHLQQQHEPGAVRAAQCQPAGRGQGWLKFPVRGGQMHVYIAEMIAEGRKQEKQRQGANQEAADNQQPQPGQPQQGLSGTQAGAAAHVPKLRQPSEVTAEQAPRKKQRLQQQPTAIASKAMQQDLLLPNTLAVAHPVLSLLLAAAMAPSRPACLNSAPTQPAAATLPWYMLPPAAVLPAAHLPPSEPHPPPPVPSITHQVLLPSQLAVLSTAVDGLGVMQQQFVSMRGLC